MKKIFIILMALCVLGVPSYAGELKPILESEEYQDFLQGSQDELSKLLFLLEYVKESDLEIKAEGFTFSATDSYPYAKFYLITNYADETAEEWIKKHCYRSFFLNEIVYSRMGEGKYVVFRDFGLEVLADLENALASQKVAVDQMQSRGDKPIMIEVSEEEAEEEDFEDDEEFEDEELEDDELMLEEVL